MFYIAYPILQTTQPSNVLFNGFGETRSLKKRNHGFPLSLMLFVTLQHWADVQISI